MQKIKDVELVECKGTDGKIYFRTPCSTWTRVMGYLRPTDGYNLGKKSEFYSRKYFDADKINNSEFLRKYSTNND